MKSLFLTAAASVMLFGCTSTRMDKTTGTTMNSNIENVNWKLVTLEGQPVKMMPNQEREIYFALKPDGKRVEGFSGCNIMNGTYTLEAGNRIRFSPMAATMRACPDVNVKESDVHQVFELADNYTINNGKLSLNVGRRAPLAVFEATPMK